MARSPQSSPQRRRFAAVGLVLALNDPATLSRLEDSGLSFQRHLGPLAPHVVEETRREIAAEHESTTASHPERAAKARRLDPNLIAGARFELVGVVHRPDRAWHPAAPCGELRLIYRPRAVSSLLPKEARDRLPVTISVVHAAQDLWPGETCKAIATKYLPIPALTSPRAAVRAYMRDGGAGAALRRAARPRRIELNALTARWPSTEDIAVSDQSHYILRAFTPTADGRGIALAPLDATPDVARLRDDAALRGELISWLQEPAQIEAARRGEIVLPERYLAKRIRSVAPYGSARLENRPFTAALGTALPSELLSRLDESSCAGCHQARSLAGFHFLGFDPQVPPTLALTEPASAYYAALQAWREETRQALVRGVVLPPLPVAERLDGRGLLGDLCDTATASPWTCGKGLVCDTVHNGQARAGLELCSLPRQPPQNGDACDASGVIPALDALDDRLLTRAPESCMSPGYCAPARAGFPGGMCGTICAGSHDSTDAVLCTRVPELGPFTQCVDAGQDFRKCAKDHSLRVAMRRCTGHRDCRPDYACVMDGERRGLCAPTYFVPELNVPQR